MQNPIPGKLVKLHDKIFEPEEDILIWDADLSTSSILIQRGDRFLEVYPMKSVRIKSDLVMSRVAPVGGRL